MSISRSRGERALVVGTLLAVAGLVIAPLVRLAWVAIGDGSVRRVLRAPGLARAAEHSLELAVLVPLFAVPLGTGMALLLNRPDVPMRGLLRVLAVVPLLVPQFVLGYSWTQAYARGGFTDDLMGVHWNGLTGPAGIVVVLVVDAVPLAYLMTTVGLRTRAHPELDFAARVAGAGPWDALRTVTLPLLRPVLAAEFLLTFVLTLESFAAPQVLGAPVGYATLTTRLYADLALAGDPASFTDAVTLALGLVLMAAVVLVPADLVVAPALRSARTSQSGHAGAASVGRRKAWSGSALLLSYAGLAVGLPTVALVAAAITRAIGLPPTPGNWTLDNFRAALDGPTRTALAHSLELSALAAVVLVVLGAVVAVLERYRSGRVLGTVVMLTFAVPGSTLAVGLLVAYDRWLGSTLALILLAYLAKFWALAHRTVSGSVDRLPPGEWQAARVSGASAVTATRTIWLPALAPALLGAAVLVFVSSLHEVTMSSLLYSAGSQTFAVAVLNSQELGDTAATAALSVTLTAVLVAVAVPAWLLLRARRKVPTHVR